MSPTLNLQLRGGRVIDPSAGLDQVCDLFLSEGRIAAVGVPPDGFTADRVLDLTGCWVIPGVIDLRARLREPGQEHKAHIKSETLAAARSGVTTLLCPPDTDPVIDTPAVAKMIQERARTLGHAEVLPCGALTAGLGGEMLSEMAALKKAGCVVMAGGSESVANPLVLRRALQYAANFDLPVFITPFDQRLADGGCAHEGRVATRLGLPSIPVSAETAPLALTLAIMEEIEVQVHFGPLSAARSVELIAQAQRRGLRVSAGVAAHQLFLNEHDTGAFDPNTHLLPPLRESEDLEALREAVRTGTISAICSDHQPHEPDAKLAPFPATEPGISAIDTLLPLLLQLHFRGYLERSDAIERISSGPAKIIDREQEIGGLRTGMQADICVIDPEALWRVTPESLNSRGHNTPFIGWELRGRVTHTLQAGRLTYEAATSDG